MILQEYIKSQKLQDIRVQKYTMDWLQVAAWNTTQQTNL